jgi:maltose phosphorylase
MAKIPTKYLKADPWAIIEQGFHPNEGRVSESIFSLANEYMGVRGYFDEGYSGDQLIGSYINGVWSEIDIKHAVMYKGLATHWTFMVNAVDWLYTRISLDGERLDLRKSIFENFTRTLDLKNGIYTREFTWTTLKGKKLKLIFTRFTSMIIPNMGCQQITLEALNFDGQVELVTGLDFNTIHESIQNRNHWRVEKEEIQGAWLSFLGKTERSNIGLFSSFTLEGVFVTDKTISEDKKLTRSGIITLKRNTPTHINKLVINYSDKKADGNSGQLWNEGKKITEEYSKLTYDSALAQHKAHWNKVWQDLDIEIDGDHENQQGIRYCLFQLYQTNHGQNPANNVGAKGLTGEIYSGHTFWDTEAYCLPFYLFTNPTAAKNLLLFRHKTLTQAKEWSIEQNCKGACYPMETIDGRESCPVWWHGNLEIHVPGAVGYGIWHYHKITGDDEFLYKEGIEMLSEICRFYASRGDWREDDEFGFYGVMGPDEFHTFVNNNYYTNLLAQKLFRFTLETLDKMADQPRKPFMPNAIEADQWRKMADTMILPKNQQTGVFEQHEGYFLLPHLDIHSIPVEEFPLYHNWTLPRIYRYDMIKQPDVLLSLFFFSHDYSMEEKKANYEYYEPRCIHESSLSPSVHSILAAELGKKEEADQFFDYATRLDLDNYNRNTNEGLHITSIAAAWLNIVYGFAGMRSDGEQLSFRPTIPEKWKKYAFRIQYQGARISVEVTREKALFRIENGINNVQISVFGTAIMLSDRFTEIPLELNLVQ